MTVTFAKLGQYGRLGNMLWQISATISHALKYNDTFLFPDWDQKSLFNIPHTAFTQKLATLRTSEEPHFHYSPIPYWGSMNLHGYYQSYLYWQDHKDIIKQYLTPTLQVGNINKTALHVRRTDYLTHKGCYQILDRTNYYDKALEHISPKEVLIFSDDIAWCKSQFTENMFEFSEVENEVYDLANMISCENVIIANSSFSWWGAYLNAHNNKVVVAPKRWFGPQLSMHNTKDLIPPEWISV